MQLVLNICLLHVPPPAPTTNQEKREWQCGPEVHKHLSSSSRMVKFMWGELGEGGEEGRCRSMPAHSRCSERAARGTQRANPHLWEVLKNDSEYETVVTGGLDSEYETVVAGGLKMSFKPQGALPASPPALPGTWRSLGQGSLWMHALIPTVYIINSHGPICICTPTQYFL